MVFSTKNIEQHLLETAAGRAVFDSLVQANVDPASVPVETVKQMLLVECRHKTKAMHKSSRMAAFC